MEFGDKLNCFVGLNGQGKTNVLDAIYLLSFAKSAFTAQDSLNITHGEEMAFVQGDYKPTPNPSLKGGESLSLGETRERGDKCFTISCGLRKGVKKQFRRDKKDYQRLIDHIGLILLVMISPSDQQLIDEGSDERRRFMDVVISQLDRKYLDCLTTYNALLKQRNALLKQLAEKPTPSKVLRTATGSPIEQSSSPVKGGEIAEDLLEVLEWQMIEPAVYIFKARTNFFGEFEAYFAKTYAQISGSGNLQCCEVVVLICPAAHGGCAVCKMHQAVRSHHHDLFFFLVIPSIFIIIGFHCFLSPFHAARSSLRVIGYDISA